MSTLCRQSDYSSLVEVLKPLAREWRAINEQQRDLSQAIRETDDEHDPRWAEVEVLLDREASHSIHQLWRLIEEHTGLPRATLRDVSWRINSVIGLAPLHRQGPSTKKADLPDLRWVLEWFNRYDVNGTTGRILAAFVPQPSHVQRSVPDKVSEGVTSAAPPYILQDKPSLSNLAAPLQGTAPQPSPVSAQATPVVLANSDPTADESMAPSPVAHADILPTRATSGCSTSQSTVAATEAGLEAAPNAGPVTQYVTLDQMAARVNRSKKTLERYLNRKNSDMPKPDVEGGGGKPHEWSWSRIRPWLEVQFSRPLCARFPG